MGRQITWNRNKEKQGRSPAAIHLYSLHTADRRFLLYLYIYTLLYISIIIIIIIIIIIVKNIFFSKYFWQKIFSEKKFLGIMMPNTLKWLLKKDKFWDFKKSLFTKSFVNFSNFP